MKKSVLFLISIFATTIFFISCKRENAVEYNNNIIKLQRSSIIAIDNLKKAIDSYNTSQKESSLRMINAAYDSCYFLINKNIELLNKMEPFKGDDTLRIAAIALLKVYIDIVENNYKPIIELYKLPADMFTIKEHLDISNYDSQANKMLDKSFNKFLEIQKNFAKKYNLQLE